MSDVVSFRRHENLGLVTIDHPPVNALSRAVRRGLLEVFTRVRCDASIQGIVLNCAGRTFVAGADINEFASGDFSNPDLNDVIQAIEALDKPVVAAIHGNALGGGFELALGCHYRVALRDARIGLPEVTLGVLPGAGGTQRLPRLIGVAAALETILGGRPVAAPLAHERGAIDAIVEGDVLAAAIRFTQDLLAHGALLPRASDRVIDASTAGPRLFEQARSDAARRWPGAFAPARIVDCIEAAVTKPFAEGLAFEREQFIACLRSPQSIALRHLFFAEREAARIPGTKARVALRGINEVGIVGAGTMGTGIAIVLLDAGLSVRLLETNADALARGTAHLRNHYAASAEKGRIRDEDVDRRLAQLSGTLDAGDLAACDLVIEAVYEDLDVKLAVSQMLGRICKPGAILATNTSTLDVDRLAQATGRATDVVGMHFFSPANVMRLLEVVRGAATAPDVLATVMSLAKRIGKVAVVSGVCYGFIGNRMLEPYLREAERLLLEGASPQQVDGALEAFGMAMGPLRMMDLAGVDVCARVVRERVEAGGLPADPCYRVVCRHLFEQGRHGQKSGLGFYRYQGREPRPDPDVGRMLAGLAERYGVARRTAIDADEIVQRCLFPLVNEGARVLDEGIAIRPGDIDVVWTAGYGFPRVRGGPMHFADAVGLDRIRERLLAHGEALGDAHGYWTPAPLLARLADSGQRFADLRRDHATR